MLTGHPRSGTTLLEQGLDAHPDAISAEELTIFASTIHAPIFEGKPSTPPQSELLDELQQDQILEFRHSYQTLMTHALGEEPGSRLTIDKNPDILPILPSILRVFPEARLLIALRDPRDILISIFSQALPLNHNAICHLDLESSARFVGNRLGLWIKMREKLSQEACEMRYEEVVQDFPAEIARALEHLGLSWNDACADPSAQARQKVITSPTYSAVREPINTRAIGRWKNYLPWIEPHLVHMNEAITELGYK